MGCMQILLSLCRCHILYDQSWRSGHCATKAQKQVCQGRRHVDWGVQTDRGPGRWWRLVMKSNHVSLSLILRVKLCPNSQQKKLIFKTILYSKPTPVQENYCEFLIFKSNAIRFHEIWYCYGSRRKANLILHRKFRGKIFKCFLRISKLWIITNIFHCLPNEF